MFIFFGIVAVPGTHYLQGGELFDSFAIILGAVMGLMADCILIVNNIRDADNDGKTGKRTLAVIFGKTISKVQFSIFALILLNSIWVIVAVTPIGLLRLIPFKPFQIIILKINEKLAEIWLHLNKVIQDVMHGAKYRCTGDEKLRKNIWQFTTINHLSWADIFLFLYFTNFKMFVEKQFIL